MHDNASAVSETLKNVALQVAISWPQCRPLSAIASKSLLQCFDGLVSLRIAIKAPLDQCLFLSSSNLLSFGDPPNYLILTISDSKLMSEAFKAQGTAISLNSSSLTEAKDQSDDIKADANCADTLCIPLQAADNEPCGAITFELQPARLDEKTIKLAQAFATALNAHEAQLTEYAQFLASVLLKPASPTPQADLIDDTDYEYDDTPDDLNTERNTTNTQQQQQQQPVQVPMPANILQNNIMLNFKDHHIEGIFKTWYSSLMWAVDVLAVSILILALAVGLLRSWSSLDIASILHGSMMLIALLAALPLLISPACKTWYRQHRELLLLYVMMCICIGSHSYLPTISVPAFLGSCCYLSFAGTMCQMRFCRQTVAVLGCFALKIVMQHRAAAGSIAGSNALFGELEHLYSFAGLMLCAIVCLPLVFVRVIEQRARLLFISNHRVTMMQ